MLKAVIFDLDGTLTDSDKVHFEVYKSFFAEHNIELDRDGYRQKVSGRQNNAILADFLPQLSAAEKEDFSDRKEETFRYLAEGQLEPLPGLLDLLSQIKRLGLAAAVVTNAPPENAAFMLSELWLTEAFSPIVIGNDLPRGKPDPLPYQTALDKLAIHATEAIAFEDSIAGIRSAIGAGIKTIGMTTTHSAQELIETGAVEAVADFTDPYIQTCLNQML
ncbi:MAG: putative phosphatase/phosphohexomutase [Phormidesmis priestleyi Ana]|uniref:Putative phosphatase/phosphohexomutase n=1 Tax=Phormidesmis priestleyi Ana TaxID=1666911 RepID=A0A0P7YYS8_9CYAN|nr:MAG: putative phosphatase/phosphohexomutase [Phormidesmis priestleyi Ana]